MKLHKTIISTLTIILVLTSCDDDPVILPLTEGTSITLRNTLQDPGQSEVTYPSLFNQADDAFDEFATLSNTLAEFPTALAQNGTMAGDISGLYNIDFTETSINFTVLPELTDSFWGGFAQVFGVTPAGKTDRYYFTFSEAHNINGFRSNNTSVNVRIDSNQVIVVEIGEGFDVQPGATFKIILQ